MVYDPGKQIHDPVKQIAPFGPVVKFCHKEKELKNKIDSAQDNQLFLLLIFPHKDNVKVRRFLMKHIPNQVHLHSLYLIFPNGIQFHDNWINTDSMPKLRWCRSFTTHLIRDIRDVCESSCNANIEFYRQRMIVAQDAVDRNTPDSADSIVALFAEEIKKFSLLLRNNLST